MKTERLKTTLILLFALIGLMLSVEKCQAQSDLRQASRWHNQKGVNMGPRSMAVGYSCMVTNSVAHGLRVGYISRTGFEMGVTMLAVSDRSERLKIAPINLGYANINLFNLWDRGYLKVGLAYAGRDEIYCQAGITQQVGKFDTSFLYVQSQTGMGFSITLYTRL